MLFVGLFGNFVRITCDGLGRLIQKSSGGNTINYYYDLEVEFLELGHSINGSRTWNLYGPDRSGTYGGAQGIGGLEGAYQENTSFAYNTINNYFGDTVGIVAPTYHNPAPYPGVVGGYGPMPGSDVNHDLEPQWRGHYLDATGFYYMGARYYDPINGRFLSPDPLGHDVGLDLYSYCNGDPLNGLDPDGRCVESTLNAVPGQEAWQQSVSSFNNGDYGQATLSFGLMLSEQALTVATFGMGSVASAGGEVASSVAAEVGGAQKEGSVFWSGGMQTRQAAEAYASTIGGQTLEMTLPGKFLNAITTKQTYPLLKPLWAKASLNFAKNAEGAVDVFHSATRGVRVESFWTKFEYPQLIKQGNQINFFMAP